MLRSHAPMPVLLAVLALLVFEAPVSHAEQGTLHQVRPGETLASIASQHGITTQGLIDANGIANPDLILVGQRLAVPSTVQVQATAVSPAEERTGVTYTVRSGDTLARVARSLGVSVTSLAAANRIADPDRIYPGMVLSTPASSTSAGSKPVTGTRFIASISQQRCWL